MKAQSWQQWLFLPVILSCLVFTLGCEDDTANSLNQAQECLDKISDDAPTEAANCSKFLKGINTPQKWIIQCGIDFMVGGVTTTRIINAYNELDGSSGEDKESYFMGALAFSSTATADAAFLSCQKSESDSLIYIAALSKAGTHLSAAVGGLLGQIGSDGNGYTVDEADMQAAIDDCQSVEPNNCNEAAIGESVLALEEVYCQGGNSDSEVCEDVNKAIENSDGSAEAVADLMLCLMDKPLQAPCNTL